MHPREETMLHIYERVFKILSAVVDWIDFISIFLSTHVLIELSLSLRGVACAFTRGGVGWPESGATLRIYKAGK